MFWANAKATVNENRRREMIFFMCNGNLIEGCLNWGMGSKVKGGWFSEDWKREGRKAKSIFYSIPY
jgi:hypothetical protein